MARTCELMATFDLVLSGFNNPTKAQIKARQKEMDQQAKARANIPAEAA